MATYRLKRKTFGLFAGAAKNYGLMKQHFGNIGNAYKTNGFWKGGAKEAGKSVFHGAASLTKGTLGAGLVAPIAAPVAAFGLDSLVKV